MAVPEQTPYIEHTGNGVTTSFSLGFQCESKDHLIVLVDEIEPPIATWSLTGGNVVFTTAPAAGKKITLQRNTPFSRTTDYQSYNNSFRPPAVNKDFDWIWLKLQELGVVDMLLKIYVDRLHGEQKDYIDNKDQLVRNIISDLRNYVNQQDNNRNSYFENLISRQGISLQQLDNYYKHLLQGIANIAAEKGWIASLIATANGKNQQEINDSLSLKTYSLKDAGGVGGGANDTNAFLEGIKSSQLLMDTDVSILDQPVINKPVTISGNTVVKQNSANKHTIAVGTAAQDLNNEKVDGFKVSGLTFGEMPKASADDFGAVFLAAAKNAVLSFNKYFRTENGIIPSVGAFGWAKPGYGSTDTLILGEVFEEVKRFIVQNIQGRHTKIIGITAHNNGDNTLVPSGEANNGGANGGIRLAGVSRGNIVADSNIRDRWSAIDIQIGSKYNTLVGNYFENSYSSAINVSSDNYAIDGKQNMQALTILDAGDSGVRLRFMGHSRLDALIDTTGLTTGSSGFGVDAFSMVANDEHYIIEFSSGSGLVPTAGTVITQGTVTGVLVRVVAESLATIAVGTTMPAKGTILVKTVTGGFFKSGTLTGIPATANRAYAAEGRNRIDISTSNTKSTGLRLATNSNLVDLISTDSKVNDIDLSGKYNIVRVVVGDNPNSGYNEIKGSYNIVLITDNDKITTKTCLLISGSNNIVIGATSARFSITGSNNYCDLICSRLDITGSGNDIGGQIDTILDTGTENKFSRTKKGQIAKTIPITSDSNGHAAITHGLAGLAKNFTCDVVSADELLHTTVVNPSNSLTTSLIKVWKPDGTPATNKTLSLTYSAGM